MSLNQFESQIWRAAQRLLNNPKMRKKDLLEWSTGEVQGREGEVVLKIEELGVTIAVDQSIDKRG